MKNNEIIDNKPFQQINMENTLNKLIQYCVNLINNDTLKDILSYNDIKSISYKMIYSCSKEMIFIYSYIIVLEDTIETIESIIPISSNNPYLHLLNELIDNILSINNKPYIYLLLYKFISPYFKHPLYSYISPLFNEIFKKIYNENINIKDYISSDEINSIYLLFKAQNNIEIDSNHIKSKHLQSLFDLCCNCKINNINKTENKILCFNKSNSYVYINAGSISPPYTIDFDIYINKMIVNQHYILFSERTNEICLDYYDNNSCKLSYLNIVDELKFDSLLQYNKLQHITITSTSSVFLIIFRIYLYI